MTNIGFWYWYLFLGLLLNLASISLSSVWLIKHHISKTTNKKAKEIFLIVMIRKSIREAHIFHLLNSIFTWDQAFEKAIDHEQTIVFTDKNTSYMNIADYIEIHYDWEIKRTNY